MNQTNNCKDELMYGKIFKDFHYYSKLWKSLSRIYPSSKYEGELSQISISLQKLYEKVNLQLESNTENNRDSKAIRKRRESYE